MQWSGGSARAVQFTAPGRVDVVDVELPAELPADAVVVRTAYSGISSGTEMLAYRGQLDADTARDESLASLDGATFRYPFRYGYSCVGQVEHGVAAVPTGSWVFAFHPHQDRFVASAGDVLLLGGPQDEVRPRPATLFPLVETALQITLDAGPVLGEPVVLLGLGAVGLLTAELLLRAGAVVLAADPVEWRRDLAASLGLTAVQPSALPQRVAELTGGRGVPLVIEVSGVPQALADGLSLLAHEGTALVASWYGTKMVPLPLGADFHRRRLVIRSSQVSTIPAALAGRWSTARRRAVAVRLLRELSVDRLATTEFPVAAAADAYAALDRRESGVLHAALRYD